MHRRIATLVSVAVLAAVSSVGWVATPAAAAATAEAEPYSVTPVYFTVTAGPGDATTCDVVADLYRPAGASAADPVPVILDTNGFSGSKDSDAAMMRLLASNGYGALAYSGLGFGGSGCKISIDNPEWDGRAASQLISFLGGRNGFAYADAARTEPLPAPDWIVKDAVDHAGVARPDDPRVGMFGISYGGGIQFATAKVDKRLDTIVPVATWNDLRNALFPNSADLISGVTSKTPGISKTSWGLGLAAAGILAVVNGPTDPYRLLGCPNWIGGGCEALIGSALAGYPGPESSALLAESSVATFADQVTIPTLLMQGEDDTLFTLNEVQATFDALRANGTTTKMVWASGGHSGPADAGDYSFSDPNPATQYPIGRIMGWYDHYLKDLATDTGPAFAYYRPWAVDPADPAAAYATAGSATVSTPVSYYLSGSSLVTNTDDIRVGQQTFVSGPGALPTSLGNVDVGGIIGLPALYQDLNLPGTFAEFTGPALTEPLKVAGSPELDVRLSAPGAAVTSLAGPTGMVALYAKVYDVAPDGTRSLIKNLRAPFRVADAGKPVHVQLPAMVHEFAAGHRVAVVVAGGDLNFRGSLVPNIITIATGDAGQALTLPVVS